VGQLASIHLCITRKEQVTTMAVTQQLDGTPTVAKRSIKSVAVAHREAGDEKNTTISLPPFILVILSFVCLFTRLFCFVLSYCMGSIVRYDVYM